MEELQSKTSRRNPKGLSHLVINVRNFEESHRFWTEVVGMRLVAKRQVPAMRFYVADGAGINNHHDLAMVENLDLPVDGPNSIYHIAIVYPDRESWMNRLAYLQEAGIAFERRLEHGITHSMYMRDPNGYMIELLYDLPREGWENDLDTAINHLVELPTTGPEALVDSTDYPVFRKDHAVEKGIVK